MTGTGKTYTMQGVPSSPGLIPLAIADIFDKAGYGSVISVSYLEIYNERVRDLLNPSTPSDALKLQEQADLVRVRGLRCIRVDSAPELLELIAKGDSARKTEGTEYNAVSSRSHAVLQIFFERAENNATSVLSLCDLAGSERAASDAERRKEGAYINRSLLALGTIISRLSSASSSQLPTSDGSSSSTHIPYRDSKLTRLLQHSLSGQALVSVICTIDPHATSKQSTGETLNTLRFAARAKNITITPARALSATNAATSVATTALIESLRLDLERERAETEIVKVELADVRKEAYERAIREREMWEREKRELELQRDALKDKVGQLTRMILASSSDKRSASASARSVSGSTAASVAASAAAPASESTPRTTRKSLAPTAAVASGGNEKEGGDRGEDEIQIFLPKQRV
ncbi:kinesin motor domain-containing protein [Myxozyma melibiosi]|uniref:Kinesin-like protein n=1 Tax=Myxozyma melibiosi TaxID=54550 RepID=A0ABR1FBV5_9ASCO